MNLTGSRPTLIANLCAVVVASVIAGEAAYIEHKVLGVNASNGYWGAFLPAFIMFVIRNSVFCWCLLLLHVALAIQTLYKLISFSLTLMAPCPEEGL